MSGRLEMGLVPVGVAVVDLTAGAPRLHELALTFLVVFCLFVVTEQIFCFEHFVVATSAVKLRA